jgi:hypothetical protein
MKALTLLNDQCLPGMERHFWRYGNNKAQTDYSLRVADNLTAAGIPDVKRVKRVWYDNISTAQWEVSWPVEYTKLATEVTDAMWAPRKVAK